MVKTAVHGALIGICFLAVSHCLCNWAYDRISGFDTNAPYPWRWHTSLQIHWFVYRVLPGAPLGAVTNLALLFWRSQKRAAAVTLCWRAGFIATALLGIKSGLAFYEAYLTAHLPIGASGGVWVSNQARYWVFSTFEHAWGYGALQWAILLLLAGFILNRLNARSWIWQIPKTWKEIKF